MTHIRLNAIQQPETYGTTGWRKKLGQRTLCIKKSQIFHKVVYQHLQCVVASLMISLPQIFWGALR